MSASYQLAGSLLARALKDRKPSWPDVALAVLALAAASLIAIFMTSDNASFTLTGFYFAMVSAGAGNLLRGAQPWSGVVPSAVAALLMGWFAIRHYPARRTNLAARAAVGEPGNP